MRSSLRARHVIGYADGDHCLIPDGEVVWEDDRIIHVGGPFDGRVDRRTDCGEAVVGPGFVDLNALADVDHAIFDSFQPAELLAGQDWSTGYVGRRAELFSRSELAFGREYALVQLLLNGVTTALPIAAETYRRWAETEEEFADLVATAGRLGNRLYLGPSYRSGVPVVDDAGRGSIHWDAAEEEAGLKAAERFVEQYDGAHGGRIRGLLAPARVETQTAASLTATAAAAARLGCPVRLHAAQSHEEVSLLRATYGTRPIEVLDRFGILGPRTIVPHAWAVDGHSEISSDTVGTDVRRLADTGTTVAYCPLPSGRYGMVLESFDRYLAAGVRMGIGTDTFPPDVLRALDLGSMLTKAVERRQDAGSLTDLYRAATLGGAAALGRDDLGRLAVGAQADLVVMDLSDLRTGPIEDPVRTIVLNHAPVVRVVVDGRTVVEDGRVPGVDADAMRRRAQEHFDTYRHSFTDRDHRRRPTAELMPPTFAVRLPA
ncbi:amidohydrolase family protein [Nocardioides ginsengisoli]|uniref:Chlorohydrolase family protein n=1 Tax=Nocardioides ginsengisoli TaxID=363868 RepID=A0ABW3VYN7_9ACTN